MKLALSFDARRRCPSRIARRARLAALMLAFCLCLAGAGALAGCQAAPNEPAAPEASRPQVNDRPQASEPEAPATEPEPDPEPEPASEAARIVDGMTLEQKVAQLFFVTPEAITGVDCATVAGDATRQAIEANPVGGLIYFAQNLVNSDQTRSLLSNTASYMREATGLAPFLGVDEEGGTVARIGGNPYGFGVDNVGDMRNIGATGNPDAAREVGRTIGAYLGALGFTVDFAPVADVANNPAGTMGQRSFGSDANLVASMVSAEIDGLRSEGVLPCAKHFPGIGGAQGDSHLANIYSYKTLDEIRSFELVPFKAAVEARVPFIMVGHLSTPVISGNDVPASLNPDIITNVLRDELGYDGIVITDSLSMAAVTNLYGPAEAGVAVLQAGADMLLMPADYRAAYQGVLDAVAAGTVTETRIDESVERIVSAKLALDS